MKRFVSNMLIFTIVRFIRKVLILIGVVSGILVGILFLLWMASLFQEPGYLELPSFSKWKYCLENTYKISYDKDSGLYMEGDNSEAQYQLISPKIFVVPFRTYIINLPVKVHQGRVAAGVIGGFRNNWLMPPTALIGSYIFTVKFNVFATIVIVNNNMSSSGNLSSHFTIKNP